jgi:hypothetical protein
VPYKPDRKYIQPKLRVRTELYRRLEREAHKHRISVNAEMTHRLEDSFTRDAQRGFADLHQMMEIDWLRFSDRFLGMSLEEDLAKALATSTDPKVAALAAGWLRTTAVAKRLPPAPIGSIT